MHIADIHDNMEAQRGESIKDIGVKNAWRWEWMEKEVDDERLGQYMRKISKVGFAYCTVYVAAWI